jgi:hypothetical protein
MWASDRRSRHGQKRRGGQAHALPELFEQPVPGRLDNGGETQPRHRARVLPRAVPCAWSRQVLEPLQPGVVDERGGVVRRQPSARWIG